MTHRIVISTDGTDFVISHPAGTEGEETKVTVPHLWEALEYVAVQFSGKRIEELIMHVPLPPQPTVADDLHRAAAIIGQSLTATARSPSQSPQSDSAIPGSSVS